MSGAKREVEEGTVMEATLDKQIHVERSKKRGKVCKLGILHAKQVLKACPRRDTTARQRRPALPHIHFSLAHTSPNTDPRMFPTAESINLAHVTAFMNFYNILEGHTPGRPPRPPNCPRQAAHIKLTSPAFASRSRCTTVTPRCCCR